METKSDKITVLLGERQVLFREGIHFTLSSEDDMEVLGEEIDNEAALNSIETNPPRVAILNAGRDQPSGIDVVRRVKRICPSVSVILIMDGDNEELLFSAVKSGASALLTKDVDPGELVNTIREVVQGASPISEALLKPAIASRVLSEFEAFLSINREVNNLLTLLSARESEVLHRIADGNSSQQVSQTLGINEETIRQHLNLILTKLVTNDHSREVVEAVLNRPLSMLSTTGRSAGRLGVDYVTKEEFTKFKESLKERFKSFIGEWG